MSIGERIRRRREELGISQIELAELIGYKDKSTISKIESGDRELRQSKIKAIADALQTTTDYIMEWDNGEEKIEQLVETARKLTPGNLNRLIAIAEALEGEEGG